MTLEDIGGLYNYWVVIFLMMTGFFMVIQCPNMVKKIIGINIFQTSVFMLFITMGKVRNGTAPILDDAYQITEYSNPLPHVLILTAIVVSVATTAVGLALVVRIKETYKTIEADDILKMEEGI